MRTIHAVSSSILALSFITACSGGSPGDETATGAETTAAASEDLSNGAAPHVLQARGTSDQVVGGSCAAGSSLSNPSNNPVMHGTVNIYLIAYGGVSLNLITALETYIPHLSESSYLATNSVYTDKNGPTTSTLAFGGYTTDAIIANANGLKGAPYSQGKTLTDASIKTEVDRAITKGVLPLDSNGIYFVITDNQVTETNSDGGFCATKGPVFCGWHTHGTTSKTDIKYSFIGDGCSSCQWPGDTPHGTQIDSDISVFTHELIETLTDPDINAWRVPNTTKVIENGDLCAWKAGPTYHGGQPDFFGNLIGGAADLHLGSDDYLVQMNWVNPDNAGSIGYGLPFWEQNFGWSDSPIGDWAPGSYKAQCASGQPVTGISSDVSETFVNSVLCGSDRTGGVWPDFPVRPGCYGLSFDPGNNMIANPEGDWDFGNYKAECNTNEFVAGVSQTTSGQIDGIMCCPGTVTHKACAAEVFYGRNSPHFASPDWDSGYYKGQCADGKYVAGVSSTADGWGSAHALLCCSP
jgi:hypothetical protein